MVGQEERDRGVFARKERRQENLFFSLEAPGRRERKKKTLAHPAAGIERMGRKTLTILHLILPRRGDRYHASPEKGGRKG